MVAYLITDQTSSNDKFRVLLSQPPSDHADEWYRLCAELNWDGVEADVYLAFIGSWPLQLSGFLVTAKSKINNVIAHCPVETDTADWTRSYRDLRKQLQLARRIAQDPQLADQSDDAISLVRLIRNGRTVPRWVYARACIPLSYPTDGEFLYPTPFCPHLLSALNSPR